MSSVKLSKDGVEIAFAIADENSNFFKLGSLTNPVIPIPLHPRSNYEHSSYLSQPPQPAVVYFFLAGVLFSIENAKFWPTSANLVYFVANLRTFWCTFTGVTNVVYQNGQI